MPRGRRATASFAVATARSGFCQLHGNAAVTHAALRRSRADSGLQQHRRSRFRGPAQGECAGPNTREQRGTHLGPPMLLRRKHGGPDRPRPWMPARDHITLVNKGVGSRPQRPGDFFGPLNQRLGKAPIEKPAKAQALHVEDVSRHHEVASLEVADDVAAVHALQHLVPVGKVASAPLHGGSGPIRNWPASPVECEDARPRSADGLTRFEDRARHCDVEQQRRRDAGDPAMQASATWALTAAADRLSDGYAPGSSRGRGARIRRAGRTPRRHPAA